MIPARKGLCHQPGADQVQSGAAVGLGNGDAKVALLAQARERFGRPPLFFVHARRQWMQFLARVAIGGVEYFALLGAQVEGGC